MKNQKSKILRNSYRAITLVELMIGIVFLGITMLAVGIVIADSHKSWSRMYERTYSDVVTESHTARRTFDRIIRQASTDKITLDSGHSWVKVYYYSDPNLTSPDRYARFYQYGDSLKLEHGNSETGVVISSKTLCSNVQTSVFNQQGRSVQMILRLDDGSQTQTVVTSAVAHN